MIRWIPLPGQLVPNGLCTDIIHELTAWKSLKRRVELQDPRTCCCLRQLEKTETHLSKGSLWIINTNQKINNRKKENCLTSFSVYPKAALVASSQPFPYFSVHDLHTACIHWTWPSVLLRIANSSRNSISVTSHTNLSSHTIPRWTPKDPFENIVVMKRAAPEPPPPLIMSGLGAILYSLVQWSSDRKTLNVWVLEP